MPKTNTPSKSKQPTTPKKNKIQYFLLFILVLIAIGFLLRPGVFTIQPVDAIPEGTTIVYILRDAQTPFYTSLHPECFYSPTSVSLICNAMVKTALNDLSSRIILRLPYNHTAYLKGSNGIEPGYIED
jgi:hypothetical protein